MQQRSVRMQPALRLSSATTNDGFLAQGYMRLCPQLLPGPRMRPEERGAYIATRVHRQDMGLLLLSRCPMLQSHYLMYHYLPSMYHYWSVRSPGTHRAHPYLVSSARSHDGRRGP